MHHYGFLIAQIFFGLWLVPLGYLAYKSGMFPKALGVVLIVGGVCYLVDMLALFLVPDFGAKIHGFLAIPPTIAEVWMVVYLLVKGVKAPAQGTAQCRARLPQQMCCRDACRSQGRMSPVRCGKSSPIQ